jgi:hypothetical protein
MASISTWAAHMVYKTRVTFRGIDPSTVEKLRELTAISGCSMGALVNSAVASWCPDFPEHQIAEVADAERHDLEEFVEALAKMIAEQDRWLNELYRLLGCQIRS